MDRLKPDLVGAGLGSRKEGYTSEGDEKFTKYGNLDFFV